MKDLVVLIPGIGGSVLTHHGKSLWDFSPGAFLRGVLSLGRSIDRLKLGGDDWEADDLGDGVEAPRLLPDLHIIPGLDWRVDGYGAIAQRFQNEFDCIPGQNYFELPYDWRRDNRVAARKLARSAHEWLRTWRESSGNNDAKLILVGHSMGGIVARLYLEMLDGWRDTRALITFGTPYSGSVNALDFLANGFKKGWGPFTVDISATLRSFTSVYQLLPSYRCMQSADGQWVFVDDVDWTATEVDGARAHDAVALGKSLREQVNSRLQSGDRGYDIRPVVGSYQRTLWSAQLIGGALTTQWMRTAGEDGGDGTVPLTSAFPHEYLEQQQNVSFVSQRHASLQNDVSVLDHVGALLRYASIPTNIFTAADKAIALEVSDALLPEPLTVRARIKNPGTPLTAVVVGLANSARRTAPLIQQPDGWSIAMIEGLEPQDYRVTVTGQNLHNVSDVASVVDELQLLVEP